MMGTGVKATTDAPKEETKAPEKRTGPQMFTNSKLAAKKEDEKKEE